MQKPAQDSTPRRIMGAAYLIVFVFDTLWAGLSVLDYFDWNNMQVNGMGIVKIFVANRLFRVFTLNAVSLVYYSINTAGGFATTTNIAGAHSYRLLDTYTNVNVTLYFVEFLIAKIELKEGNSRLTNTNSQHATKNDTGSSSDATGSRLTAAGATRSSVSK
ncbi:hypothetical protein HDV05_006928 [Chytridiales sp. JEL 0842]|nr:hypothetical protein HDV05_006928 [Chytridiales sp. JEL 0842]